MDERRKFTRILFSSDASVTLKSGEAVAVKVVDLSLNGALVEWPEHPINEGEEATLIIKLNSEEIIQMDVVVSHIQSGQVGLKCEFFDIDSATSLRRLIELNIADDSILNRELTQLGN